MEALNKSLPHTSSKRETAWSTQSCPDSCTSRYQDAQLPGSLSLAPGISDKAPEPHHVDPFSPTNSPDCALKSLVVWIIVLGVEQFPKKIHLRILQTLGKTWNFPHWENGWLFGLSAPNGLNLHFDGFTLPLVGTNQQVSMCADVPDQAILCALPSICDRAPPLPRTFLVIKQMNSISSVEKCTSPMGIHQATTCGFNMLDKTYIG